MLSRTVNNIVSIHLEIYVDRLICFEEAALSAVIRSYICENVSHKKDEINCYLVEHCTGRQRLWVRIPFKPEVFFRLHA